MRVLVLGVTGMLGNAVFKVFDEDGRLEVWGTLRSASADRLSAAFPRSRLAVGVDVLDQDALVEVMNRVRPDVIVNCVGLVKHLPSASDPLEALPINAMLPHRLTRLCRLTGARLIHISTDCVFSGRKGDYRESDPFDAEDLYGFSKYLGELRDDPNSVTLRTSIIGHELGPPHGLVDWFLSREGDVDGYARAIFSGLPTVELSRVMRDYILPRPDLAGLYHVSASPISKLQLLRLIADVYGKRVNLRPDDKLVVDRSLNSDRFTAATGYVAPEWPKMIKAMHDFR